MNKRIRISRYCRSHSPVESVEVIPRQAAVLPLAELAHQFPSCDLRLLLRPVAVGCPALALPHQADDLVELKDAVVVGVEPVETAIHHLPHLHLAQRLTRLTLHFGLTRFGPPYHLFISGGPLALHLFIGACSHSA